MGRSVHQTGAPPPRRRPAWFQAAWWRWRCSCGSSRRVDVPVLVLFDVFIGGTAGQRVFEVPHVAVDFDVLDLEIGNRGLEMRVPVHQTLAAIDEALVIHIDEDLDHGVVEIALFALGAPWPGHGEGVAVPVTARRRGA